VAFEYVYSSRAAAMRPSPIRELFKMIQRPGMISFAGGLPDPAIFPVKEFAECSEVLSSKGHEALQYGATEGYRPLVLEIARRMEPLLGRPIAPEEVVISSGSQQAMDMLSRVLIDPGDVVVAEAPTYPGALHTFRAAGARFALVPCDSDGMQVDLLADTIERSRLATGRLPKLIYTIVNYSNPSGACLAEGRRRALADVAARFGIPVFEDDPYGELRYRGERIPALFSMAPAGIVYASSFSKILAPGVRVAWAVGDASLIRKMVIAKQGMDLCTSVVAQVLVATSTRTSARSAPTTPPRRPPWAPPCATTCPPRPPAFPSRPAASSIGCALPATARSYSGGPWRRGSRSCRERAVSRSRMRPSANPATDGVSLASASPSPNRPRSWRARSA
jgi:2-aminoadipate transaminase